MKIAVACSSSGQLGHFGHCDVFRLYDVDDASVLGVQEIPNPGHRPGFLPNFLAEQGAKVIVSGCMGAGAMEIFKEHGIEVVLGAEGSADDVVAAYLSGTLRSTGAVCAGHGHDHEHGHHHGEGHSCTCGR